MQGNEINEKERYQEPEFEVVHYSNDDIITTSGLIPGDGGNGGMEHIEGTDDEFETEAETGY